MIATRTDPTTIEVIKNAFEFDLTQMLAVFKS